MGLFLRGIVIWLGAAGIVAGFYWADQTYGCGFFQRGGAALVVYTVLVGIYSMRERAAYGDELHAIQREQCHIAQAMYAEEHETRQDAQLRLRREIEPRLRELDKRLERLLDAGQRFLGLRVVEGPLLVIATAVWGFGDLAVSSAGCAL